MGVGRGGGAPLETSTNETPSGPSDGWRNAGRAESAARRATKAMSKLPTTLTWQLFFRLTWEAYPADTATPRQSHA